MMYALSFVLATTVAASNQAPSTGDADAVVRIGPRSGKLQFRAFSRLTDPFGQFGSWRGEVKIPGGDLARWVMKAGVIDHRHPNADAAAPSGADFLTSQAAVAVFTAKGLKHLAAIVIRSRFAQDDGMDPADLPSAVVYAGGKLSVKADFTRTVRSGG